MDYKEVFKMRPSGGSSARLRELGEWEMSKTYRTQILNRLWVARFLEKAESFHGAAGFDVFLIFVAVGREWAPNGRSVSARCRETTNRGKNTLSEAKGLDADEESAAMEGKEKGRLRARSSSSSSSSRRSRAAEIKINKRLRGRPAGRKPSLGLGPDSILNSTLTLATYSDARGGGGEAVSLPAEGTA